MSRLLRTALTTLIIAVSVVSLSPSHFTRAQGDQVFSEDFSDNSHNWQLGINTSTSAINIKQQAMTLEMTKADAVNFAMPDSTFPRDATFTAEITPQKESDTTKWYTGIIIRADTRDRDTAFYEFDFGGDSIWTFSIRTAKGDTYKIQKSDKLKDFDPMATHKLSVKAVGSKFTYSIDGNVVDTFTDNSINPDLADTYAGIVVGTYKDSTDVKVEVTSFEVTSASSSSSEPTPQATGSDTNPDDVLLQDTFASDNANNWLLGKTDFSSAAIDNDQLVIQLKKANWLRWSVPETLNFQNDVDVSVDASYVSADKTNSWFYGIGVRDFLKDKAEFMYLFEVSREGKWAFERRNGDKGWETISPYKKFNVKSFDPKETNTLRVTAVGDHFEFYVNGTKVGEADDDTIQTPDVTTVALMGGTLDSTTASVAFTNLSVVKP